MKHTINALFAAIGLSSVLSCVQEVDHAYSRFPSQMEITASASEIVLNEDTPDEVALTVSWTPAKDYGDDFIMTYEYEWNLYESTMAAKSEYEDFGMFVREYTHSDLQKIMIEDFGYKTSSWGTMQFTVSVEYEGTHVVLPEEARVSVSVKTYGPKQFAADKVSMAGTAVGAEAIVLLPSEENPSLYVWNGTLAAGTLNFPVEYGDEQNVIVPAAGEDQAAGLDPMPADIVEYSADAAAWNIPTSEDYRVTLNFEARTVSIVPLSAITEIDMLYMSGSALSEETEIRATLENAAVYAWRGELKAGELCFPIEFEEERNLVIVPSKNGHELLDGQADVFTSVPSASAPGRYWEIPADGIYRVVVDTDAKSVKIYSAATDMKNVEVSYNNTVDKINPYTQEVTALWMYGTFNGFAHDSDSQFSSEYMLEQSLADPAVFVWYKDGKALPRQSSKFNNWGDAPVYTGSVNFYVSNIQNNVYAYGSTADAVRNDHTGAVECSLGETYEAVAGQSHNRYALFLIPEGANYVEVNIEKLTVTFKQK